MNFLIPVLNTLLQIQYQEEYQNPHYHLMVFLVIPYFYYYQVVHYKNDILPVRQDPILLHILE